MKLRRVLQRCTLVLGIGTVAVFSASCGDDGDDGGAPTSRALKAPSAIAKRGTLTFCSDIGYPPQEFFDDGGKPAGADIDIGRELAKRLGVRAAFENTPFDGIIEALKAHKCDAIISALTNNAERRREVVFVDYLRVGQSLLVQTANDHDVDGLGDLGGLKVAVQEGTTNQDFLAERVASGEWGDDGPPLVRPFIKDEAAAAALADGTVDAYYGDSPTAAYYIGQAALTYAFAGDPINPEPMGIAVRPDDRLAKQLQRGVDAMYDDGSMRRILKRWKLEDFTLN